MTRSRMVWIILGALVVAGASMLAWRLQTRIDAPVHASVRTQEAYWTGTIQSIGGARAYAAFAASVAALPPSEQHQDAHAFGGALFSAQGVEGLTTCDARFNYGCYHEFLGRAIASLGLGVVQTLNKACVDALGAAALSCQHGIGHGIEAALGYDDTALKKSLALCKDLPYSDPIGGCYGGVFMEYNMQTMLGDQGRIRSVTNNDLLYPCDVLGSPYKAPCVFWSPQWWLQLQHTAHGRDYRDLKQIGTLCESAGSADLVRSCFEGLGTIVPPEGSFDPKRIIVLCNEATTVPRHALYCLSYAANALTVGGSGKAGDGARVCDGLSGTSKTYCLAYAANTANLAGDLPDVNQ